MHKAINYPFREQLGERLREARNALGESQKDFAQRLGVTKLSVLKYEAGAWCPTAEQLYELEVAGIDAAYVAFGTHTEGHLSLANPATRRQFATVFSKVYQESLKLAPDATEADLIEVAWAVFSDENLLDDADLTENVRLALSDLAL